MANNSLAKSYFTKKFPEKNIHTPCGARKKIQEKRRTGKIFNFLKEQLDQTEEKRVKKILCISPEKLQTLERILQTREIQQNLYKVQAGSHSALATVKVSKSGSKTGQMANFSEKFNFLEISTSQLPSGSSKKL